MKKQNKDEKSRDFASSRFSKELVKLRYYFKKIKKEKKLTNEEIFSELTKEPEIPVSVFNETLSGLETISKYLKENLGFKHKEIAKLLNRSEKTIWQAYYYSKKKFPQKFFVKEPSIIIPVSVLSNRNLSILESIALYLKDSVGLRFHEIASLLKRDHSTIWTVYRRVKDKTKK